MRSDDTSRLNATIYVDERNYEKAADSYMRALELTERRLGASHPNLTMILNNLGLMYIAMRRYEEAERHFRRSLDILERNGLMSNYLAFRTLYGLGRTYVEKNDRNQAEALLARAVQIGRSLDRPTHDANDRGARVVLEPTTESFQTV